MKRYESCSKILADTRIPNTSGASILPCFGKIGSQEVLRESFAQIASNLLMREGGGGVCLVTDFYEKEDEKFKISSLSPLIIVTKGGYNDQ